MVSKPITENMVVLVPPVMPDGPTLDLPSGHTLATREGFNDWVQWANETIGEVSRYFGTYMVETYKEDGGHAAPDPDGMDAEEFASISADYFMLHIDTMKLESLAANNPSPVWKNTFSDISSKLKGYACTQNGMVPENSWRNINSMASSSNIYTVPSFDSYKSMGYASVNMEYNYDKATWEMKEVTNRFGTILELPETEEDAIYADPFVTRLMDYGIDCSLSEQKSRQDLLAKIMTYAEAQDELGAELPNI